ncbi:anion permease [Klebsiella pneumoniae]
MKEKKTTIPPAGAVKPTTANKKPLLMMALPIIVAVLLLFVPVPEGLPPYAWHYFAIFVGVIVGLIFEPLPGAVIGITGVVVIALCSQWLLFSPDQMAAPGFKMAGASFKWAVSGFGNSTVWLIFGAFMFAAGYDKTQLRPPPGADSGEISWPSQPDARLRHHLRGSAAGAVYAV